MAYPLFLGVRNALSGDWASIMFLGRRTDVAALPSEHGRLFETTEGFTRRGLDVDALRMYLRWRGTSLEALRSAPAAHRDPESVGETFAPTDGAVDAGGAETEGSPLAAPVGATGQVTGDDRDGGDDRDRGDEQEAGQKQVADDDPWAAARFIDDVEGSAYGTTPETLREGLAVVTTRETVWLSPGLPFIVPLFVGLCVALAYGDVLFAVLRGLGVA
jgi:preflagellin peptidase FlaK